MHPQKKTSHLSLINANYLQIIITFAHHFKITLMESKISYKVIYNTLKDQILKEAFPPGSMLPTEQTLAQKYSVSRPTIAKVYNQLHTNVKIQPIHLAYFYPEQVSRKYSPSSMTSFWSNPKSEDSIVFGKVQQQVARKLEKRLLKRAVRVT